MRQFGRYILLFGLFLLCVGIPEGNAQAHQRKTLRKAREEFDDGNIAAAIDAYTRLVKLDSSNGTYNYEFAQVLYSVDSLKIKSIPYFETAQNNLGTNIPLELYYFLGKAYQLANRLDQAIASYKNYVNHFTFEKTFSVKNTLRFKSFYSTDDPEGLRLLNEVKKNIQECKVARDLQLRPSRKFEINGKSKEYQIENLGLNVNSNFDDYGAVIAPNDSLLFFTSRRKVSKSAKSDPEDGKFHEHIYVSKLEEEGWGQAQLIGSPISSMSGNESVDFISSSGTRLYYCKGLQSGTFYYSTLVNNHWTNPTKLENAKSLNALEWKTSLAYSEYDSTLYVVSDKPGGFGKRDIYTSTKLAGGIWGPLVNLGPTINTEFDEESPFVTADGKTLYFSSNGYNSIGGFDIYRCDRKGTTWSYPVNLGTPINTTGNDMYFMLDQHNGTAYYSSSRAEPDVDKDDMDIFSIVQCDNYPLIDLQGLFTATEGHPRDLYVTVEDNATHQQVGHCFIDKAGHYRLRLLSNNSYTLNFQGKGIVYFSESLTMPKLCKGYEVFQKVEVSKRIDLERNQWVQKAVIKNCLFDIQKKSKGAKFNSPDPIKNYTAYLATIDPKTTRLNYNEHTIETCLSDLIDDESLKLSFVDTLNHKVETASAENNGLFTFHSITLNSIGQFHLEGQDPEVEYKVQIRLNQDTIQLVPEKDYYVLPQVRMNFYSRSNRLLESTIANKANAFVFRNIQFGQKGYFKLENDPSNATTYLLKNDLGGKTRSILQYKQGTVFPFRTLQFYSAGDSVVESSVLAKDTIFSFYTISPEQLGHFKLLEQDDSSIYGINLYKNYIQVATLQYQLGQVYPRRHLDYFDDQGELIASTLMDKNRKFDFKSLEPKPQGIFKIRESEADTVYTLQLVFNQKTQKAIRVKNGYVLTAQLQSTALDSINSANLKNKTSYTAALNQEKVESAQALQSQLNTIIEANTETFKKQLEQKVQNKVDDLADTTPSFPIRKLHYYSYLGEHLAAARLSNGGLFLFNQLPQAGLFKLEGEDADTTLPYRIQYTDATKKTVTLSFHQLQLQDGTLFIKKQIDFYNKNGDLVETASINKEGTFQFHKVHPNDVGLFKLQADSTDNNAYNIDFVINNKVVGESRFETGYIYPRKKLQALDEKGAVIESVYADRNGAFSFRKINPDAFTCFKPEEDIDVNLNYTLNIPSDKGAMRTLRYNDLQSERGVLFEKNQAKYMNQPNKVDQNASLNDSQKQEMGYYDADGNLLETATLNQKGEFLFTTISPNDKGFYRLKSQTPASPGNAPTQYTIKLLQNQDTVKTYNFKQGYLYPKELLAFYNKSGKLIEQSELNSDGKFPFKKIPFNASGYFRFITTPPATQQENFSVQFVDGENIIKEIPLHDMTNQEGALVPLKKMYGYNKKGDVVETAIVDKSGQFVFHKIAPDAICFFKLDDETIQLDSLTSIVLKSSNGNQKELKLSAMRVENNCHFEDKVLTYKNEKGESEEAAHINKEGSFVFTHIPKDPAGTFKLQGNANDPSLYAIKIIEKNHNEKQLQFQDGKTFPLAYLNFIDANGVLVEKSCLSKDGSFHFDRIDTADRGTFKLEGDSKDPALIKLQVVASNQEIQAIAFSKDSIVRIDKIIDKVPVSPLSSKDAVKLTTLKNQLIAESNPVLKRKIAKQVLAFEAKQEKPVAPPVKPVVSRATNAITKEQIKKEVLAAIARTSTVHASVPKETPVPASSSTNNNSLGDTLVTPPIASNFENILFEFASCHLSSVYTSELKQVADVLKANRKLQLELDGHTDNVGNESYNLKLSARRVHTVEAYLQNRGISSKRIKTRNMGKDYPLEPNQHPDGSDNPEGRKKNRRVEIKLLNDSTK